VIPDYLFPRPGFPRLPRMAEMRATYAHLIGREADTAAVVALLDERRLVTLTGPGGVGKTRLADHLFPVLVEGSDDLVLVALDGIDEPGLVGHAVGAAIGLRAAGDVGGADYLAARIGDRRLTLVLDNCERVVDAVAALVAVLIERCPAVKFLATSQIPLGIAAETVYPLRPLEPAAALDLFVDRARSVLPSFELTAETAALASAVVRSLEGLPLAIELATARLRVLSLESLQGRLQEQFDVLGGGFRDAPERHRSLTASIAWIDELCTPGERTLWARLSVFVGGFDLLDAEQVCSGDGIAPGEVLDLLAGLVDKSVVVRVDNGRDRYRMLETLRHYGASRLEEAGATAAVRDRHCQRFEVLAHDLRQRWVGPEQAALLQRYDEETPNLRAALEHALAAEESVPLALRLCFDLKTFWVTEGLSGEARYWMDRALAPDLGSPTERALVAGLNASMAIRLGDVAHARTMVDRALVLLADIDDPFVTGAVSLAEGQVLLWELEIERGMAVLRTSTELLRAYPDRFEYPSALVLVGLIFTQVGAAEEGRNLLTTVAALGEVSGESTARAYAEVFLAFHTILAGDAEEADRLLRSSLELVWVLRDQVGIALQLEAAAYGAQWKGMTDRCAKMLGAAETQWRRMDLSPDNLLPGMSEARFDYRRSAPLERAADFAEGRAMLTEDAVRLAFEGVDAALVLSPAAASHAARGTPALEPLSRRESEVAMLIADGMSNREIATRLFISERTAQGHVQSCLRRLDFGSRAQIAAWVVRRTG